MVLRETAIALLVLLLALLAACGKERAVERVTPGGTVTGVTREGVEVYRGIPYAEPPVGNLRWALPLPVKPWKETLRCTTYRSSCPQPEISEIEGGGGIGATSEDCLYLNVWSPVKKPQGEGLPVMVWIHGGAFMTGSGSQPAYDGMGLAAKGAVIVTINYRLGPFGFLAHPALSRESPHGASGNYGLYDQIEALRWVQKNIAAFGGDPGRVTLFGESAGALSIGYLLLSPLAKGLFQRAIMQSGAPTSQQYIMLTAQGREDQAQETGRRLAARLGCVNGGDCLKAMRARTTDEVMKAAAQSVDFIFNTDNLVFAPIVDGVLLPDRPEKLLKAGRFHKVPVMAGTNKDEASVFTSPFSEEAYRSWVKASFKARSKEVLAAFPPKEKEEVNDFLTALWFTEPVRFLARSFTERGEPVYLYHFTRVPEYSLTTELGAFHGQEIEYIFGDLSPLLSAKKDQNLSQAMMDYWLNFARTANPNSKDKKEWPLFRKNQEQHMEFGDLLTVKSSLMRRTCDFIEQLREESSGKDKVR